LYDKCRTRQAKTAQQKGCRRICGVAQEHWVLSFAESKGAQGLAAKVDTKATGYYLQIQPDGTLKLVPPMEGAGAAR
jgi:hypothetical protein